VAVIEGIGLTLRDTSRIREKIWLVFKATRTHARNLAKFATIYKLTCYLLKHYGSTPGKEGLSSLAFVSLSPVIRSLLRSRLNHIPPCS